MRWPKACLGDVAQVVSGATPKSSVDHYWDGDIPWITPADLSNLAGKEVSVTSRRITAAGLSSCSARLLPARSVLFSSRAPIGHVAINTVPMATNQGFKSLVPDHEILSPDFLYWWLKSNKSYLQSLGRGATFKEVSKEIVESIEIPLPPLEEQRRIATILDKVRSIQNRAEARKAELRSFEESLFNHFFGSTQEQRGRWEWEQFGSLCSRLTVGVVVKPASYYREKGVPALRSLNVKPGAIVETNLVYISEEHNDGALSKSRLSCGDLVFVRSGRPGTCAVIPSSLDGCNAIDLLLATADSTRILPGFASSYFNSAGGKASIFAESRGQVQQHFNAGSLASALVPVPPIEIQAEFCNILRARNSQGTKCELSLESLKALSKALEMGLISGSEP
jgi:type I restriction enzyme, S subunit